jgi:hypothetical protein
MRGYYGNADLSATIGSIRGSRLGGGSRSRLAIAPRGGGSGSVSPLMVVGPFAPNPPRTGRIPRALPHVESAGCSVVLERCDGFGEGWRLAGPRVFSDLLSIINASSQLRSSLEEMGGPTVDRTRWFVWFLSLPGMGLCFQAIRLNSGLIPPNSPTPRPRWSEICPNTCFQISSTLHALGFGNHDPRRQGRTASSSGSQRSGTQASRSRTELSSDCAKVKFRLRQCSSRVSRQ